MSFKISFDLNPLLSKIEDSTTKEIPISYFIKDFEKLNSSKNSDNISKKEISTPEKFTITDVTTGEESISVYFKQGNQKIFISIFGPKEMRNREKANGEHSKIELFIKFSLEPDPKIQELLNQKIKKFLKNVIMRDSYPKCQIIINMNIFNTSTDIDTYSLIPKICNGLMTSLCLSGIDINMLCLARGNYPNENNENRYMIFMEQNNKNDNNIYDIETEEALSIDNFDKIIEENKIIFKKMYENLIHIIYKKLK